jgi:hypothetical protein
MKEFSESQLVWLIDKLGQVVEESSADLLTPTWDGPFWTTIIDDLGAHGPLFATNIFDNDRKRSVYWTKSPEDFYDGNQVFGLKSDYQTNEIVHFEISENGTKITELPLENATIILKALSRYPLD